MLLDYYGYTLDDDLLAKFMPLLSGTLDFFGSHYGDVSKPGSKLKLFPTQGRIDGGNIRSCYKRICAGNVAPSCTKKCEIWGPLHKIVRFETY